MWCNCTYMQLFKGCTNPKLSKLTHTLYACHRGDAWLQTGYNLLCGCWKYSWDADCELFLKILRGEVKEDVYAEQIQLQVLLFLTNRTLLLHLLNPVVSAHPGLPHRCVTSIASCPWSAVHHVHVSIHNCLIYDYDMNMIYNIRHIAKNFFNSDCINYTMYDVWTPYAWQLSP